MSDSDFRILRFLIQPWDKYDVNNPPRPAVSGADHVSLTYLFRGDNQDLMIFIAELRHRMELDPTKWMGIRLRDYWSNDSYGSVGIVDCNPNFHRSVKIPQELFHELVLKMSNKRILNAY